jgi:hypothetical protein
MTTTKSGRSGEICRQNNKSGSWQSGAGNRWKANNTIAMACNHLLPPPPSFIDPSHAKDKQNAATSKHKLLQKLGCLSFF